jgi:predicted DNA-binding transcriptional regulator AlpA
MESKSSAATVTASSDSYRLALDTAGAAQATGLSEFWLAQLRSQNRGPKWLKVGKRALYRPADLEAWLAEHVQQPKAA